MKCQRTPYLVLGTEPFLVNYQFGDIKNPIKINELTFDIECNNVVVYRTFKQGGRQRLEEALHRAASEKVKELAKKGAYTYESGRIWVRVLLQKEPYLAKVIARRFPHILVDEAQDIGPFEAALLESLSAAGSTIALVGDVHQSIYDFRFASGQYLREFSTRTDVQVLPLAQNRRSVEAIVNAANKIAGTGSSHVRSPPERITGAYFWRYDPKALPDLMSSWLSVLNATGFDIDETAVLCRGSSLLEKISTEANEIGSSAVKHFAAVAIEREQTSDISKVFEHCAKGVAEILSDLPDSFLSDVKNMRGNADIKTLRQLMWSLIRTPETGIPISTIAARSSWLPKLKQNLDDWLKSVEQKTKYKRELTWRNRVTVKELPDTGVLISSDIGQHDWSALRCGTVHSAKGEGISAVMYLTDKDHLNALVKGTNSEDGRIGYVAVTRSRDLLVIAVPSGTPDVTIEKLKGLGFTESGPSQLTALATKS